MKNCGKRFHSEVGKFRFLNELIKVVSPKVGLWVSLCLCLFDAFFFSFSLVFELFCANDLGFISNLVPWNTLP